MNNEKVKQILECVFTEESRQAAEGCPFVELECWDSLRYVHLVISVQATFGIELNQTQILRITTLHGLCDVLREHGIAL
jgi:acyl carrier protein